MRTLDVEQRKPAWLSAGLCDIAEKICTRMAAKEISLNAQQLQNFLNIHQQQLSIVLDKDDTINTKLEKLINALN